MHVKDKTVEDGQRVGRLGQRADEEKGIEMGGNAAKFFFSHFGKQILGVN